MSSSPCVYWTRRSSNSHSEPVCALVARFSDDSYSSIVHVIFSELILVHLIYIVEDFVVRTEKTVILVEDVDLLFERKRDVLLSECEKIVIVVLRYDSLQMIEGNLDRRMELICTNS